MRRRRLPRPLHPAAWWCWALCLSFAASRTTNPLVLALLVAVAGYVVAARRQISPWSRSFVVFLRFGLLAIVIRVVLFAFLAPASGAHVLFTLPVLPLPSWVAGLRLGGPVALEGLLSATYDGMRLAVIFVCIGAANSLTSPRRLLKSMPAALYEAGVALTVALAFIPQAVSAVSRIRAARRLRGRTGRGVRALRGIVVPVLEGALERSVDLAAAMDARGFGRRGVTPPHLRRLIATLTLAGLLGIVASMYALLDPSAPRVVGLPLLAVGSGLTAAGFVVGRRRGGRTRYRPDRWGVSEWLTVGCGVSSIVAIALGAHESVNATSGTAADPVHLPTLSLLTGLGLVVALLPAWCTPPLPAVAPRATP